MSTPSVALSNISIRRWGADPDTREHCGPAPIQLRTECKWVVEGPAEMLDDMANVLPKTAWRRPTQTILVLELLNSVGSLKLPTLGRSNS